MSWVLAFAGFAVLIIAHEAGHMVAAKAVGMRVERFFLFFPPKLWSTKRGETEYGIGAIPLGGFVKITGMNPDEKIAVDVPRAAGSELGGRAVAAGEGVDSPQLIPATEHPRSYYHQPVWKRIVVIGAGPFVNLVIAFVILFGLGFGVEDPTGLAVGSVEEATPAQGNLEPGDRLVSINGVERGGGDVDAQADRLTGALADLECKGETTDGCRATEPVPVVVERDGRTETLLLTPFYDEQAGRFRFGFSFEGADFVSADFSAPQAAEWALDRMWFVTSETVRVIANIFDPETREQISGIVGSYEVTRQSIEFDTRQALGVLAIISLSLAVINMFPFLPLDGGHIFWSLVEKVRGKPVSFRVMERASVIGFALVLMLFVIGLSNDIDRLSGEGFDIR